MALLHIHTREQGVNNQQKDIVFNVNLLTPVIENINV